MTDEPAVLDLMDSDPAYADELGAVYQGDSRESLQELPDDSIDLVVTSPPFALQHTKEYGNENQEGYNDWFIEFAEEVYRVLAPHGSFVIEIGGAFEQGWPKRSTYQFKLLSRLVDEGNFDLAQDFYWYNPAKLPNPIEWVNVRKIRVTDAVTHIWWLSKDVNKDSAVEEGEHPSPEANNQRVLQEYSDSHKDLLETGEYNDGERGSGWTIDPDSFANKNEGSIPDNLIEGHAAEDVLERWDEVSAMEFLELISDEDPEDLTAGDLLRILGMGGPEPDNLVEASNTASNTHYLQMCREFGFDHHPARFPREIPEFFISFLSPDGPYDERDRGAFDRPVVLDIFAGSNLTGKVAQSKGRYWLGFEQEEQYVETSQFRFMNEDEIRDSLNDETSDFGEFAEVGDD